MQESTPENSNTEKVRTLNDAASEYISSSWFSDLSEETKKQYVRFINFFDRRRFNRPIKTFTAKDADGFYMEVRNSTSDRTAQYFVSVWRVIFRYAEINGWVDRNPWSIIRVRGVSSRRTKWSREQVALFVDTAESHGDLILAAFIQLLYDTAQRPTDILEADDWILVDNQWFLRITQNKTGAEVCIPFSERAWVLCGCPQPGTRKTLLGCDLTLNTLRKRFNALKLTANLPTNLQMRDLRRTAITEMGETGSTDDQMQAVSGHKNRETLTIYSVPTTQKTKEVFERRFKE